MEVVPLGSVSETTGSQLLKSGLTKVQGLWQESCGGSFHGAIWRQRKTMGLKF